MNPNLMEQFLGPSTQYFRFNSNDINVLVTPIEKKTCLLTKRNVFTPSIALSQDEDNQSEKDSSSMASTSTTRIRFSANTNGGGGSSRSQLGVNTVITNTNRYNLGNSNGANGGSKNGGGGLRTSSSSSSLLRKSSKNYDFSKHDNHFLDLSSTATSLQTDERKSTLLINSFFLKQAL